MFNNESDNERTFPREESPNLIPDFGNIQNQWIMKMKKSQKSLKLKITMNIFPKLLQLQTQNKKQIIILEIKENVMMKMKKLKI